MDPKEIEQRAMAYGRPFLTLGEVAVVAGVSRVTIWRLPEAEKPRTWTAGGAEMLTADEAVRWAKSYWSRK